MNIIQNIFMSAGLLWAALFLMVIAPAKGAVTAIPQNNESDFLSSMSGAVWNARIIYGSSSSNEFGISPNGNHSTYTENHDAWIPHAEPFGEAGTITLSVSIAYNGSDSLTLNLGDVISSSLDPSLFPGDSSKTINPSSFTTLGIGVESRLDFSSVSFSTKNAAINGEAIPDLFAQGDSFSGLKFAISEGEAFTYIAELEMSKTSFPALYGPGDAIFRVYGDNSLESVPEPSSASLIAIFGIITLLRRSR